MSVKFINLGLTKYPIAMLEMEIAFENVNNGNEECVFITEHEALYSAGKSFERSDFIIAPKFPIYFPKRGGRVTIHAPGQLVIYPIINLKRRNLNVSSYIKILEIWIIDALKEMNIESNLSTEGIGVWIRDSKIGFIGVRIEHGITTHGLCLNVSNDLTMFNYIIPCGIQNLKVTSLEKLQNKTINMEHVINSFIKTNPFC